MFHPRLKKKVKNYMLLAHKKGIMSAMGMALTNMQKIFHYFFSIKHKNHMTQKLINIFQVK